MKKTIALIETNVSNTPPCATSLILILGFIEVVFINEILIIIATIGIVSQKEPVKCYKLYQYKY